MKISKSTAIAGSALVATAAGVTAASTPLLSITAHADTSAEAYVGIQGDTERDTNSSQHNSKAFEYMTPDEAAATWAHKEDWEKEPGTDNTQTDWAIAQNTNGKTSSDTSSNVFGDSSEARFNPGDVENSKMTSLGWMKDEDNDGVKIINLGNSGSELIVANNNNNNNNNSSNNSNNSNVQNTKGKNTSVGKENNNAEKAKNDQNGNFANAVTQIGQNIQNNKDNVINPFAGGKYIINGGNASGVANEGNGTYVIRTADGTLVVSNNNNNNNNNSSNNNSNNGISNVDDNCKDNKNTLGTVVNNESEQKATPNATVSTEKVATTATVPATSATASTLNTKPNSTEKNSESISSNTNTPVSSTTSISTTDPNKLNSSENSTPTTIGTATNTGTLPQTSNSQSQDTKVASVGGVLLTSLAAMGIVPARKALQ